MQSSIRALERIQRIDLEILAAEQEEKTSSNEIDNGSSEIQRIRQEIAGLLPQAEELDARIKEADEKVRQSEERVARDEKRLNDVKNEKELNAINKEISAAGKQKRLADEERARFKDKLGELNARIMEKEKAIEDREALIAGLRQGLEDKRREWQEEASKKLELRDSIKSEVPPHILKKYEMIRQKRAGIAIVTVEHETCKGCHMHIPPQVFLQLKKGDFTELITCPHCHRILYVQNEAVSS